MTDADSQDHRPEPRSTVAPGRQTRLVVALIGGLVSLGVPAVVLSTPVPASDGWVAGALDDPAGLGATGVLPGEPLPADGEPAASPTSVLDRLFGESTSVRLPGIPTPELPDGPLGIPGVALDAYQFAERTLAQTRPGCLLPWSTLAGIGRIESNHASAGRVDAFGDTLGPILGPPLDGSPGIAAIPDTDRGVLDQDTVWDRAVGPMQFIPSSWRSHGVDGNGDGVANPNNLYDATVAAGLYLCAGGANLSDPAQLQAAIFRYNHSASYVRIVLQWAQAYLTGVFPTPSAPGPVPPGTNGNGGRPIVPDGSPLAAPPPPAVNQSDLLQSPPLTTSSSPTPTATPIDPSPEPVPTLTETPTPTPTEIPTPTPTETPLPTPTPPPTPTEIPTPTPTPVPAESTPPPPPTTATPSPPVAVTPVPAPSSAATATPTPSPPLV